MDLSYILEKIRDTKISNFPFRHLEINELFKEEHFEDLVGSPQIATSAGDDEALLDELFAHDYRVISFPGCSTNHKEYLRWHKTKNRSHKTNTACEGYGLALRLQNSASKAIETVQKFMNSEEFVGTIADKFDIKVSDCSYDAGIQKYLDGYEISPHPDIRKKALTYMVNINPSPTSFDDDYHTSYLRLKPEWQYIREFWNGNESLDRCWVPWEWCDIEKTQRANNSIVIFSPHSESMHAVKANYDHLRHQRTQMYGNLWYRSHTLAETTSTKWEDLVITASSNKALFDTVKQMVPRSVVATLKKVLRPDRDGTNADRTH